MHRAANSDHAHILGVSTEAGDIRPAVANNVRTYFRFRWLDNNLLAYITSDVVRFIQELNDVLDEEEFWAENIKPKGLTDPLILPQGSFRVLGSHARLWERSEAYGNRQIAAAFARSREMFADTYHQRSMGENNKHVQWWTDEDRLAFKHRGEKHGLAPFPRSWKYSVKLIDGFHYDIGSVDVTHFSVRDREGRIHRRGKGEHVNLDPHGVVR